jgi:hypothetical protein
MVSPLTHLAEGGSRAPQWLSRLVHAKGPGPASSPGAPAPATEARLRRRPHCPIRRSATCEAPFRLHRPPVTRICLRLMGLPMDSKKSNLGDAARARAGPSLGFRSGESESFLSSGCTPLSEARCYPTGHTDQGLRVPHDRAPGKQLPGASIAGLTRSHSARHRGAGAMFQVGSTIQYGARWVLASTQDTARMLYSLQLFVTSPVTESVVLSTRANRAGTTIQVNLKLTLKVRSCC